MPAIDMKRIRSGNSKIKPKPMSSFLTKSRYS